MTCRERWAEHLTRHPLRWLGLVSEAEQDASTTAQITALARDRSPEVEWGHLVVDSH